MHQLELVSSVLVIRYGSYKSGAAYPYQAPYGLVGPGCAAQPYQIGAAQPYQLGKGRTTRGKSEMKSETLETSFISNQNTVQTFFCTDYCSVELFDCLTCLFRNIKYPKYPSSHFQSLVELSKVQIRTPSLWIDTRLYSSIGLCTCNPNRKV